MNDYISKKDVHAARIPELGYMLCMAYQIGKDKEWACFIHPDWITVGATAHIPQLAYPTEYLNAALPREKLNFLSDRYDALEIRTEMHTMQDAYGRTYFVGHPQTYISLNNRLLYRTAKIIRAESLDNVTINNEYAQDTPACYREVGYNAVYEEATIKTWVVIDEVQYPLINLSDVYPVTYAASDYEQDYTRARYWLPVWNKQTDLAARMYRQSAVDLLTQDAIEIAAAEYLEAFKYQDVISRDVPMLTHTHERLHRYLYEIFVAAAGGSIG
jgi:hypothetical protein